MASSRMLPEDVMIDILSRLPVKSLLRFRCVSKSWCCLIKRPSFIALHFNRRSTYNTQENNNDCILFKLYPQQLDTKCNLFLFSSSRCGEEIGDIDIGFDLDTSVFDPFGLTLLGPCNGIVCITDYKYTVLCNPAIREFKALSSPCFVYPSDFVADPLAIGFGYDPNTNDYKVVRIVDLFTLMNGLYMHVSIKAEIYNLRTDSWREIDDFPSYWVFPFPSCETLFNGAFHWYSQLQTQNNQLLEEVILSFNISSESTRMIRLPDVCAYPDGKGRSLGVLNESLALILCTDKHSRLEIEKKIEIWVMNEYGIEESWTKQFSIGPLSRIIQWPLAFWRNDKILLETTEDGKAQMVSCDLNTEEIKDFDIYGVPATLRAIIYEESLVSINGITTGSEFEEL